MEKQAIQLTVDAVVFGYEEDGISVVLVKRKNEPFKGKWALPGGFVENDEPLETAVKRELEEETGLRLEEAVEQLYTFGTPGRDPRGRTVSVAYFTIVAPETVVLKAASDAAEVQWFPLKKLPELAFDHSTILTMAMKKLLRQISPG